MDQTLLIKEVEEMPLPAATVAAREDNNENEIEADEETQGIVNLCRAEANVYKCLVSVLEIGLACSVKSPKERMNMEEVIKELHLIKNTFLSSRICRLSRIQVEVLLPFKFEFTPIKFHMTIIS